MSSCCLVSVIASNLVSFLNDVDRVVARDYEPSDDDVVRARLRTMGIQEYSFSYANNGALRM